VRLFRAPYRHAVLPAKPALPPPLGWNAWSIRQKNGKLTSGCYTSGASLFTAAAKVLRIAINQLGD